MESVCDITSTPSVPTVPSVSLVSTITHEGFVEDHQPEFHALVKTLVKRYGEIPDQRVALIHFETMIRTEKPSEPWHYWKALRSEFETLESSVFLGNLYDNEVYSTLFGFIHSTITSYENKLNNNIKAARVPNPSKKITRELVECDNCNHITYDAYAGECMRCDWDGGVNEDSEEEEPRPKKAGVKAVERKQLSKCIAAFCATYPTISYVLIKAGLHYPLAIVGDHPILVNEVLTLKPEVKKMANNHKVAPKATKAAPKAGKKARTTPIRNHADFDHNLNLPALKNEFECYAHQWISYAKTRGAISTLLSQTTFVPKILIKKVRSHRNPDLLKILCSKNYDAHKKYMIQTIILMNEISLLPVENLGDNLEFAIMYCNTTLVEKILSDPDVVKAASRKNITGLLAKAFNPNTERTDTKRETQNLVCLINILTKHFTIQRFFPRLVLEDEKDSDEEVSDVEDYHSDEEALVDQNVSLDLLDVVINSGFECMFSLMKCSGFDIETPLIRVKSKRDLSLSPLMYCMNYLDVYEEDDDEFRGGDLKFLNDIMALYEYDSKDLLYETARHDYADIMGVLVNTTMLGEHKYTMDELTTAMMVAPRKNNECHTVILANIQQINPIDLPPLKLFKRKSPGSG